MDTFFTLCALYVLWAIYRTLQEMRPQETVVEKSELRKRFEKSELLRKKWEKLDPEK